MKAIGKGLLAVDDIIELHSKLCKTKSDTLDAKFSVDDRDIDRITRPAKSQEAIYLLLLENCPVYLGRSINPFRRVTNHIKDQRKKADRAVIFETDELSSFPEALSYVEFLCYYSLWSAGYCLIYNSLNVWNTLPIKSKTGPVFDGRAIAIAHALTRSFTSGMDTIQIDPPDPSCDPLVVQSKRGSAAHEVLCKALYWRPTIKEKHYDLALASWPNESSQRPQFAGAGTFHLLEESIGRRWGNYQEQKLTYDILVKLEVLAVQGDETKVANRHPFPKANLMMGNLNGGQSVSARSDLKVKGTNVSVADLELQWRQNRSLVCPT